MATPVWPASLPQKPLIDGFGSAPQDNRVTFQPEVGPPIERRRGTAVVHVHKMKFPPLTNTQLAAFEAWFQDDLASGSLHFLWNHPLTGTSYKWKIRDYSADLNEKGQHDVTVTMLRLPGAAV